MRHFSLPLQHNSWLPVGCSLLVFMLVLFQSPLFCMATGSTAEQNTITAITSVQDNTTLNITLEGTAVPTYTVYELFKPSRIVVDIADSTIAPNTSLTLPKESRITLAASTISDTTPPLTRFTFTLPESRQFSVVQQKNNIVVSLAAKQQVQTIKAKPVAEQTPRKAILEINNIKVTTTPIETKVQIIADSPIPSYTYDVLDKKGNSPPRLYIDINNVTGDTLLKEQNIGTALAAIRVAKRGTGLRFVLDSSADSLFPFQVNPMKNGLEIRIQELEKTDELSELIHQKQTIDSHLPQVDPLQQNPEKIAQSVADSMQDAFNFSSYNKERITVDFYKIDLHNVFRLLREVSKVNLIVDEEVTGSLTLALNDVPWDFALDIILNLKDLQKEERYNTIVILPKNKDFFWPAAAEDVLSVDIDEEMLNHEQLKIEQIENTPPGQIVAKQLIDKAIKIEAQGDYEKSIEVYEQALTSWKDNAFIANRIASIYLIRLNQNAKAAYFAGKALNIDHANVHAALNAAIAYANMGDIKSAKRYFELSINDKKPTQEALLSYSAFIESQQQYSMSLKLLNKQDELYGKDLNSMVAQARILDKQGKHETATNVYRAILLSGFRIPQDLKKFITGRVSLSQSM